MNLWTQKLLYGKERFMTIKFKSKSRSGAALVMVLLITVMLSLIALAANALSLQNIKMVRKSVFDKQAYYAAEAGLSRSIAKLNKDMEWNGYNDPGTRKKLTFKHEKMPASLNTYTVWVCNRFYDENMPVPKEIMNALDFANETEAKTLLTKGTCYILSEGRVGDNNTSKIGVFLKSNIINADEQLESGEFPCAIFADIGLTMGQNASIYAGVGTNSGMVDLGQCTKLTGNILLGPEANFKHGQNPDFTNADPVERMSDVILFPEVNIPAGLTSRTLESSYKMNTTINLEPGHYSQDLKMSMGATVNLKGKGPQDTPTVYVFQNIDLGQNSKISVDTTNGPVYVYVKNINVGQNSEVFPRRKGEVSTPDDLRVYSTGTTLDMGQNHETVMALYAPGAKVRFGQNMIIHGTIIGKSIDIGQGSTVNRWASAILPADYQIAEDPDEEFSIVSKQRF
jgi:Tfp pilus assembly protein PilX